MLVFRGVVIGLYLPNIPTIYAIYGMQTPVAIM